MAIHSSSESLIEALQSHIIPNQEYLLQGSILDSSVEHLLHRLKGLCDNVDTGPEPFHDHEICLSLRSPTNQNPLMLRVRRALDVDAPYQLRYIGNTEIGPRPTLVRSSIDVGCTASVLEFLTELGCRIEFEYVNRGFMFRKGRMKVTVSKIYKMNKPGEPSEAISSSYLVELSVLAPSGQEAVGEEMKAFAEQLKPLVQLDKIDWKSKPLLMS